MLQKKNEGILFSAEIRVVGSYTDRLLTTIRDFKVMLIYCPNLKSDLKVTLIKASVILHI